MGAMAIRTTLFSAAAIGFALIGAGCSHATKSGETTTSATTSVTSSATSGAASPTSPSAAPSTTQMTGANGTAYTLQGPILDKYNSLDEKARKDLGAPTHEQVTNTDGGLWQPFDGGVIIYKSVPYVVWGVIRDGWIALGGSQGKLGYPTSDEVDTPDGQKKQTFEHGTLTWKPGDAKATVTYS